MTRDDLIDARLRAALTPTPQDEASATTIVDRVLSDTSAHGPAIRVLRVRPWVAPAAATAAAVALAGGVGLAAWLRPSPPPLPASPAATVLTVRCTPDAVVLDAPWVDAQADGVHVRLINETDMDVGPAFRVGDEVTPNEAHPRVPPRGSVERTLSLQPGRVFVACLGAGKTVDGQRVPADQEAALNVRDPGGHWRGTAVEAGCPLGGIASWAGGPGRGRTAEEAVRAWPSELPSGERPFAERPGATVRPVEIGYAKAPDQYWVFAQDGRPQILLRVHAIDEAAFEALPEWLCQRATDPAPS